MDPKSVNFAGRLSGIFHGSRLRDNDLEDSDWDCWIVIDPALCVNLNQFETRIKTCKAEECSFHLLYVSAI